MSNTSSQKPTLILPFKNYVFMIVGLVIFTFGYSAFMLPNKLTGGGVAGIASVLYFGTGLSVGLSNFILNGILVLISLKTLGKRFAVNTVFCTAISSVLFYVFQDIFTAPLVVNDLFLNSILGAAISAIGVGITISYGGNTGGTDIIILMILKYKNIPYGRISMYINVAIIASSYLVVHDIQTLIYCYVYMFAYSYVSDMVMDGYRKTYQIMIFSNKSEAIAARISGEVKRGITILKAAGWYSKQDKDVLLVLAHRTDKQDIMQIIKQEDPDAFISIANVQAVFGVNFDELKKI
ncbi:MAG: YitT family protein [Bacteroidales bacterium]|nr:YitT family protein [Bacteroidales bacterium]